MRAGAVMLIMALGLGACASASPAGGVANYDALKKAHADCVAKGGTLVLQENGDPEYIGDYACERK